MTDTPWLGDACSLVDAFRAKQRSPVEELEATLAAIAASDLNAFSFLDPERAIDGGAQRRRLARRSAACRSGSRSSSRCAGWPATEASLVFRDRIATTTSTGDRAPARRRRRRAGRAHDRERVRRSQRQRDEAQRRHAQPVAARPHGRRLVGRQRGRGGRRARDARDRRRRRRLDPHPRRLHRAARHEGHVRPHPARPRRVVPARHGRARLPRPFGARRGALLRRVRGLRPDRPVEPARADAVGGRPRHARPARPAGRGDPALGGVHARARRRGARPRVGDGADRRDRHGRGRRAARPARTSPRSG